MHSRLECWQELQGDSRSHLIFLYLHQSQTEVKTGQLQLKSGQGVEQWKGTRGRLTKEDKRREKMDGLW
jgi:hypothetical protein